MNWLFALIWGLVLFTIIVFGTLFFIRIPQMRASCEARNMTLYSTGRDYFCVDKDERLYIIK